MTQQTPAEHFCSRCGAQRTKAELNGYDPLTHNFSNAYCIRVAQCQSPEAEAAMAQLANDLAAQPHDYYGFTHHAQLIGIEHGEPCFREQRQADPQAGSSCAGRMDQEGCPASAQTTSPAPACHCPDAPESPYQQQDTAKNEPAPGPALLSAKSEIQIRLLSFVFQLRCRRS